MSTSPLSSSAIVIRVGKEDSQGGEGRLLGGAVQGDQMNGVESQLAWGQAPMPNRLADDAAARVALGQVIGGFGRRHGAALGPVLARFTL